MASEYTQSSFVGLDIFHMFPSEIKPNNTDFILANARNKLPFESDSFDYIHLGDMGFCFTEYEFDYVVVIIYFVSFIYISLIYMNFINFLLYFFVFFYYNFYFYLFKMGNY